MDNLSNARETFERLYRRMRTDAFFRIRQGLDGYTRDDLADWAMGHAWHHWQSATERGHNPSAFWSHVVRCAISQTYIELFGKTGFRGKHFRKRIRLGADIARNARNREVNPAVQATYNVDSRTFLKRLTRRQRRIVRLRLEGYKVVHIARILHVNRGTVNVDLQKVRAEWRAFRGQLAEHAD